MEEINEKWDFNLPIMIPSLKRFKKGKKAVLMIDDCLEDLFNYYNATSVNVLAQEYTEEDKEYLMNKWPTVNWRWHENRLGIVGTFNNLKDWGCTLDDAYIHYDDDVRMKNIMEKNPTLLAYESLWRQDPDRIGIVTAASISIHHFFKHRNDAILKVHCNPAQLVLINTTPAKECRYDERFENFRSDTDFTMQIASKGYLPLIIHHYFSFMHTIPMSTIEFTEDGTRKFRGLDNVTESKGSVGGDRRFENKKREYDQFNEKWPRVVTQAGYRAQLLQPSVKYLTKYTEQEIYNLARGFDKSLIKDKYYKYYGDKFQIRESNPLF